MEYAVGATAMFDQWDTGSPIVAANLRASTYQHLDAVVVSGASTPGREAPRNPA